MRPSSCPRTEGTVEILLTKIILIVFTCSLSVQAQQNRLSQNKLLQILLNEYVFTIINRNQRKKNLPINDNN